MRGKVAQKEKAEHRIRLNDAELGEVVGALGFSKQSGRGNLQLIDALIGRLSHPRAGGNSYRGI